MSAATRACVVDAVKTLVTAQIAYEKSPGVVEEIDVDIAAGALDEALADHERSILEQASTL